MSLEHDIWFNLAEKAAFMPDGVKFCGIICNAEVWLVKDKAVEEFLRGPSAKPAQANPVSLASEKERAELRDRFAMAALTGLLANANENHGHRRSSEGYAQTAYDIAAVMLRRRDYD